MPGITEWLVAIACVGHAALVALALARVAKSPLALRVAVLSAVMFGWNFAFLAYRVSGEPTWHVLDLSISPLSTAVALHFVLAFVGEVRRFRAVLVGAYAGFAALGLASAGGLVMPALARFGDSAVWSAIHVALEVPSVIFAAHRLRAELGRVGPEERGRGHLVLAALGVTVVSSLTEFGTDFGVPLPKLASIGSLVGAALLALAALRFRLLEAPLGAGPLALSLGLGLAAVLGYLAVFEAMSASGAALIVGISAVTVVTLFAARSLGRAQARGRAERERLLLLGRMAAQMAHDLKNPLAAMRAMIQYLEVELGEGRSIDAEGARLALMRGQVDRLTAVIDKYRRLGAAEPALGEVSLNRIVEQVVAAACVDAPVDVVVELAPPAPVGRVDADLVASVIDNLLRNAIESSAEAERGPRSHGARGRDAGAQAGPRGRVVVRTSTLEKGRVCIEVEDDGVGIPAQVRERVFDDFFTTKARGTGLGLGFVRRVVAAHGGELALDGAAGEGTRARVVLPAA